MQELGWVKEQWQGTPSRLRLWMLGEYPQGQRWICCRETSESPCPYACAQATVTSRKNLFSSRFRTRSPACAGHADWGGPRSCVFRSPVLLLEECPVARLEVARCASHGGAVTTCHSFASRDPMFSYFGQKVQDKPRKLLLASIKPPWKFKAFHKVF